MFQTQLEDSGYTTDRRDDTADTAAFLRLRKNLSQMDTETPDLHEEILGAERMEQWKSRGPPQEISIVRIAIVT